MVNALVLPIALYIHYLELRNAVIPNGLLLFYWPLSFIATLIKLASSTSALNDNFWYFILYAFAVVDDLLVFCCTYD